MVVEPTCDHEEIRLWAIQHGAKPAERMPEHVDGEQPVLVFCFFHSSDEGGRIRSIPWDDFFARFDLLGLSFLGNHRDPFSVPTFER